MSNPYREVTKISEGKKKLRKVDISEEILVWRDEWKERGPIEFAENVLACPPDVPPHPKLGRVPEFIILTEDQKQFLEDIWKGRVKYFILSAGRGSGKTFILAIYTTWRLCCFDNFTMTVMGGSQEQSIKIKEYIDFWRRREQNVAYCLYRSVAGGNQAARISSRWESFARFPACSIPSSRGSHVTQLLIDEVCVGESRGADGAQAIQDATYQLTSSSEQLLGYTSTAQYILGTFYETWVNAEKLQFRKYRWSLAKHRSQMWYTKDEYGRLVPNWTFIDDILYKDTNPENWEPNVWWVTQEDIEAFRRKSTNDQWLVEILGGISRGSGLVFSRDDLKQIICSGELWTSNHKPCEVCEPYGNNCPMMEKLKVKLEMISDRRGGVDFGDIAPNAMTVVGKRGGMIFVLYSDERTGLSSEEVLNWIDEIGKQYQLFYVFADPESRAMREGVEARGYNSPHLWAGEGGNMKSVYTVNVKRFVEKHAVIIPKKFEYLTDSIKQLSYDKGEKIRKVNDHSWDSWMYSMRDYDIEDMQGIGFYSEIKNRQIEKIW